MDAAAVASLFGDTITPEEAQQLIGVDRDVALRISDIFKPPNPREELTALFESCRPYEVRGNDSAVDIKRFLMNFTPFHTGKVPSTVVPAEDIYKGFFKKVRKGSDFSNFVGEFLSTSGVRKGLGEEYVAAESIWLQKLWGLLDMYNPDEQLNMTFGRNMAERGSQFFNIFQTGSRPDSIGTCKGSLLLYSEEKKDEEDFDVAVGELTSKLGELPSFLYGKLKFLLCYAATPQKLQFYIMQPSSYGPRLHRVVPQRLKNNPLHRIEIVLVAIKVYFLLLGMSRTVSTQPMCRLNCATKHERSIIKLDVGGCRKIIPRWDEYEQAHGVKFETVKLAYAAVENEENHLIGSVSLPKLIKASELSETEKAVIESCNKLNEASELSETQRVEIESSESSETEKAEVESCSSTSKINSASSSPRKRKVAETSLEPADMVYVVKTSPLCGVKIPTDEAELRELATGVLCALKALHSAGLVHRDIREPNVMYDYETNRYVLIDLESVCQAGAKPCLFYDCWDTFTLDRGSGTFTVHSDYRLLGLLLRSYEAINKSSQCQEFIRLLLGKQETLDKLLQHSWLNTK